jgi:hypothetical protein
VFLFQNCIDSDFACRVRAVVPISAGQEITSTYTLTLSGTMYRRQHLKVPTQAAEAGSLGAEVCSETQKSEAVSKINIFNETAQSRGPFLTSPLGTNFDSRGEVVP